VKGSKVLVVGVAYKRDISDLRESPALDIMRLLDVHGAHVSYHDPYVPQFSEDGHDHASVPLTREALAGADAVMIVTDHTNIDYGLIRDHAKLVVDTRNALRRVK